MGRTKTTPTGNSKKPKKSASDNVMNRVIGQVDKSEGEMEFEQDEGSGLSNQQIQEVVQEMRTREVKIRSETENLEDFDIEDEVTALATYGALEEGITQRTLKELTKSEDLESDKEDELINPSPQVALNSDEVKFSKDDQPMVVDLEQGHSNKDFRSSMFVNYSDLLYSKFNKSKSESSSPLKRPRYVDDEEEIYKLLPKNTCNVMAGTLVTVYRTMMKDLQKCPGGVVTPIFHGYISEALMDILKQLVKITGNTIDQVKIDNIPLEFMVIRPLDLCDPTEVTIFAQTVEKEINLLLDKFRIVGSEFVDDKKITKKEEMIGDFLKRFELQEFNVDDYLHFLTNEGVKHQYSCDENVLGASSSISPCDNRDDISDPQPCSSKSDYGINSKKKSIEKPDDKRKLSSTSDPGKTSKSMSTTKSEPYMIIELRDSLGIKTAEHLLTKDDYSACVKIAGVDQEELNRQILLTLDLVEALLEGMTCNVKGDV